jgi:hypothetical protein
MIKIKLSIPGFGDRLNLSQFLGNKENIHGSCKFYVNDPSIDSADFWFVMDDLQRKREICSVPRGNVFFISAESVHPKGYYDELDKKIFLDQFAEIITCHDIFRDNAKVDLPFQAWMINANHGPSIFGETSRDVFWLAELRNLEKSKLISVFCSAKTMTADHSFRLKFVRKLKDHFGSDLDWFGNGVQSISQKWDGIAPYKYHIVLENQARYNIITEKLYDSYLGLAFPIYWGAPNVADFFSEQSYRAVEMMNWRNAITLIEDAINSNLWENRLQSLIESKQLVVSKYNPFIRIANIAKTQAQPNDVKETVELFNVQSAHMVEFVSTLILESGS